MARQAQRLAAATALLGALTAGAAGGLAAVCTIAWARGMAGSARVPESLGWLLAAGLAGGTCLAATAVRWDRVLRLAGLAVTVAALSLLLIGWHVEQAAPGGGASLCLLALPALPAGAALGWIVRGGAGSRSLSAATLLGLGLGLAAAGPLLAWIGNAAGARVAAAALLLSTPLLAAGCSRPVLAKSAAAPSSWLPTLASVLLVAVAVGVVAPAWMAVGGELGLAARHGWALLAGAAGIAVPVPLRRRGRPRPAAGGGLFLLILVALGMPASSLVSHIIEVQAGLAALGAGLGLVLRSEWPRGAGRPAVVLAVAALASPALAEGWPLLEATWQRGLPAAVAVVAGLFAVRVSRAAWPCAALASLVLATTPVWMARQGTEAIRVVARSGLDQVEFHRSTQELVLRRSGREEDRAGPGARHADLLAHVGFALAGPTARTVVLGVGTGRVPAAMAAWRPTSPPWVVDDAPLHADLLRWLGNDGPVPAQPGPEPPPAAVAVTAGLRGWLLAQPAASVDLAVVALPLQSARAFLASEEFHAAARRALGPGVLLQSFPMRRVPLPLLRAGLASAAAVHPWVGVLLAGDTGLVVCSAAPPDPAAVAGHLCAAPEDVLWALHGGGIGDAADLELAWLGCAEPGTQPLAGRADLDALFHAWQAGSGTEGGADLAAWLGSALRPEPGRGDLARARLGLRSPAAAVAAAAARELAEALPRHSDSILLRAELHRHGMDEAEQVVRALAADDPGSAARAAAAAARWLHLGSPRAMLQAALALPDRVGTRLQLPAEAAACAAALDPRLGTQLPPVLAELRPHLSAASPLEDFARLPDPGRIAASCLGTGPLAVALRARHPSRCARALIARWGHGPLSEAETVALRQLADAFVIRRAAAALGPQRRRELLSVWRADLPLPPAVAALAQGDAAERRALAGALRGRLDGASLDRLADLLVDPAEDVRQVAALALVAAAAGRVDYDPRWPESRLRAAAARLRELHNRSP